MKKKLVAAVGHLPAVQAAAEALAAQIQRLGIAHADIDQFIQLAEHALKNPRQWGAIRAHVLQTGIVTGDFLPAQYDANFVLVLIAALHIVEKQTPEEEGPLTRMRNASY